MTVSKPYFLGPLSLLSPSSVVLLSRITLSETFCCSAEQATKVSVYSMYTSVCTWHHRYEVRLFLGNHWIPYVPFDQQLRFLRRFIHSHIQITGNYMSGFLIIVIMVVRLTQKMTQYLSQMNMAVLAPPQVNSTSPAPLLGLFFLFLAS